MVKPGALLLLLAVAASQVDLSLSQQVYDIGACPISYYGKEYPVLSVTFNGDSSVAVCFANSPRETSQDCLVLDDGGGSDGVNVNPESPDATPLPSLPNFSGSSSCKINLSFTTGSTISTMEMILYKFGIQTALEVTAFAPFPANDVTITAKVDNTNIDSWTWAQADMASPVYKDISGCRDSGVATPAGAPPFNIDQDTCVRTACSSSATIEVTTCEFLEVCEGNNMCVLPIVACTVTGSSVIDMFGRVNTVQDQCAYSLMKPHESFEFEIVAGFHERRRKDVPLFDHMIILVNWNGSNVVIRLEQSGRVQVDGETVELNPTAQLFYGVELSKDQTGVTAKLPPTYSNMTIHFDGNSAHVSGPIEAVRGLCGIAVSPTIPTTLSDAKSSSYSTPDCETQYSDTPDSTINCTQATERCNLMMQAPFTACHDDTDPEPFITACTNTTCQYPEVDGLSCQFLEAYAKTCYLENDITLGDWRSQAGCSAVPQAFCQQSCSDNEFCGETIGERRCLCRATYASQYTSTNSLGEPTVCVGSSATLTLAGCLLADLGIDYSTLHLRDPNCTGIRDDETHTVTFSFNSSNICGTEVLTNGSQLIYKNTIMTSTDMIIRQEQVNIDFSCYYTEPDAKSVSFRIQDSSVLIQIAAGVWNYNLMMNTYMDSGLTNPVGSDTDILLNQPVWVELKTEGLDSNMVTIVTDSCWATNEESPDSSVQYSLISNGCPNPDDPTVSVSGSGRGTSNVVSFRMFEFSGVNAGEIYLHCKVELCPTMGQSCAPSCGGGASRKRRSLRSKYVDGHSALITMAWNN